METITGTLSDVRYAQNGYLIGKLASGEAVLGNMAEPVIGQDYRLAGDWVDDPKWGRQFKFQRYSADTPQDTEGIFRYLVRVAKWVGPHVGRQIIHEFGDQALIILKVDPQRAAETIRGLTLKRAQEISQNLLVNEDREAAAVELETMFGGHHLPKNTINYLVETHHSDAPARVRKDPYNTLMDVRGVGFASADRVATSIGYDRGGPERRQAASLYILEEAANTGGHTWLPGEKFIESVQELIGFPPGPDVRVNLIEANAIRIKDNMIALAKLADDERDVAGCIQKLLSQGEDLSPHVSVDLKGLAPDQVEAFGLVMKHPVFILTGAPGTGKAQPLDSMVITPSGPCRMGDIQIGDPVMSSSGHIAHVTGVFPQGERMVYRVTFSDGSSTECCEDHLWLTTRRDKRRKCKGKIKAKVFKVSSLKQIISTIKTRDGSDNHSIPMTTPLNFTQKKQPIDPYLMGLLLGDGSFRAASVIFSKPDEELLEAFDNLLPHEVRLTWKDRDDYCICQESGHGPQPNQITVAMRNFGLMGKYSHEKFIPDCYLFSSVTDRIGTLQGLMDTDGYTDGTNAEFSTSSEVMASQFQFLVESLGGTTRIVKKTKTSYTHNGEKRQGHPCYRLNICLPPHIFPFRLRRKADIYTPRSKYLPRRIIRSITPVGIKQTQCIAVDAPDNLYLTDHCILTHNTYLLRRIIQQYTAWNWLIALAAPTGKAAKRMTEMIDMPAMTIHRLLGPEPYQWQGEVKFGFSFGIEKPLPNDVVVIDEFSMVDINLAASLLRAINQGTRVLIVGDHYQLPSVGPGAVLRDLLAAGVPSYELTEIKRNTGDIVQACHAIKDGREVVPSPELKPEDGLNFRHIEESNPFRSPSDDRPGIQEIIVDLVTKRLPARGYDPVWDVQVLSPMNDRTDLSCSDFNTLLQSVLNINPPVPGTPFRVGDKVLQRKNKIIGDAFVVNGDLGEVEFINDNEIGVLFRYPDRMVQIKRKAHNLQLAYCLTIHKLQGSESPVIIFPVHSCFGGFFNRELLYTGISRAKDICITIGEWHSLEAAAARVGTGRRITRLTELIKGE